MRWTRKLKGCRQGLLASLAVAAVCLGTAQSALAGSASRESFSKWLKCPSIDQRGQLSHRDGKDAPCKFVVDHRTRKVVAMVRGKVNNHSRRPQIHKNCGLVPPSTYGDCNWTRELYSVNANGICSGIAYGQMKKGYRKQENGRNERVSKKGGSKGKGKGRDYGNDKGKGKDYGKGKDRGRDYGKGKDKGRDYGKGKDKGRDYGKGKDKGRDYGKGKGKGRDYGKGKGKGRDYGKDGGREYDKGRNHGKGKGYGGGKRRGGKGGGGKGGGGHGGGGNDTSEFA